MRIVSLVPAGTEIVHALGLGRDLVAVTHDCDHPAPVRDLPKVTSSTIPEHATSAQIDRLVRSAGERGESTFHLDAEALRSARPDVVVGQTLCRVCAVTLEQLPATLSVPPMTIPLDGESIEGVLADIERVAGALGARRRGERLVADLRRRLDAVAARVSELTRPRVACLEWVAPIFNGGHWVPEQVAIAGGTDVLGTPGARSGIVEWEAVIGARPDVLVVMPCGFRTERAIGEVRLLAARPGWAELPAVRDGRVFAVDGSAYFSRPGPRLVDGVEILAGLLHPDAFPALPPEVAVRVPAVTPSPERAG